MYLVWRTVGLLDRRIIEMSDYRSDPQIFVSVCMKQCFWEMSKCGDDHSCLLNCINSDVSFITSYHFSVKSFFCKAQIWLTTNYVFDSKRLGIVHGDWWQTCTNPTSASAITGHCLNQRIFTIHTNIQMLVT